MFIIPRMTISPREQQQECPVRTELIENAERGRKTVHQLLIPAISGGEGRTGNPIRPFFCQVFLPNIAK